MRNLKIQALDRTAPVLPLVPGVPAWATHDYRRFDVTNLYAALDLASGQVIADLTPRHRASEFTKSLRLIDREVPKELQVHVVVDNSFTHKTPAVKNRLPAHPRFVFHFTPTYTRTGSPGLPPTSDGSCGRPRRYRPTIRRLRERASSMRARSRAARLRFFPTRATCMWRL